MGGRGGRRSPNKNIPGRECLFAPQCFSLSVVTYTLFIRHCCREFRGLKLHQISNFPGLRPGPRWGSLQRSPNSPAREEGLAAPPQEPHPLSRPCGPRTSAVRAKASSPFLRGENLPPQNKFGLTPLWAMHFVTDSISVIQSCLKARTYRP